MTWNDNHWEHCRKRLEDCDVCMKMYKGISNKKKKEVTI